MLAAILNLLRSGAGMAIGAVLPAVGGLWAMFKSRPMLIVGGLVAAGMGVAVAYGIHEKHRAESAEVEAVGIRKELQDAIAVNAQMAAESKAASAAIIARDQAIAKARENYEALSMRSKKIPNDGCLDRNLPVEAATILRGGK